MRIERGLNVVSPQPHGVRGPPESHNKTLSGCSGFRPRFRANNWRSTDHETGGTTNTESREHTGFNEIDYVTGTTYGYENTGTHQLDKNGNITDDNKRELKYDAFNRVKEVIRKSDGQTVAEYTYDSMNRRFRKVFSNNGIDGSAENGTTEYYYKDWQVIEEQDGSDNTLQQYVYGRYIDEPLTRDDRSGGQTVADLNDGSGDDRLFYHCNTQYSTFALTDEVGSIVEGYQYDAYGRQTVITDPGSDGEWFTDDDTLEVNGDSEVNNPYMFQGRRFDGETGMHYYRNRYYNTRFGRFISRDPMGIWEDNTSYGNMYLFAGANSINHRDSQGLYTDVKVKNPCSSTRVFEASTANRWTGSVYQHKVFCPKRLEVTGEQVITIAQKPACRCVFIGVTCNLTGVDWKAPWPSVHYT